MNKKTKKRTVKTRILVLAAALAIAGIVNVNVLGKKDNLNNENIPAPTPAPTTLNKTASGLLIIAHGAPWPVWNKPVLELEQKVITALGGDNPFRMVKVCFMEFARPSVADGVAALEKAGCDRVIAVPLLIAPSSHSHWDIPALLGLYSDEDMERELKEEGAAIVNSKLPITLTPTLNKGSLITEVLLTRVKKMSRNPDEEAVIVLAHGDEYTSPMWTKLMKRTVTHICGKTGISYGNWAFVHVGQSYGQAISVIAEAAEHHKRVLLVGCYLSMGVDKMHQRYMKNFSRGVLPGMENPLAGKEIVTAEDGLLPSPRVAQWIADIAKQALRNRY